MLMVSFKMGGGNYFQLSMICSPSLPPARKHFVYSFKNYGQTSIFPSFSSLLTQLFSRYKRHTYTAPKITGNQAAIFTEIIPTFADDENNVSGTAIRGTLQRQRNNIGTVVSFGKIHLPQGNQRVFSSQTAKFLAESTQMYSVSGQSFVYFSCLPGTTVSQKSVCRIREISIFSP